MSFKKLQWCNDAQQPGVGKSALRFLENLWTADIPGLEAAYAYIALPAFHKGFVALRSIEIHTHELWDKAQNNWGITYYILEASNTKSDYDVLNFGS